MVGSCRSCLAEGDDGRLAIKLGFAMGIEFHASFRLDEYFCGSADIASDG